MNRDKQIEEMAYNILEDYASAYSRSDKECLARYIRTNFQRKASEIFEEIEKSIATLKYEVGASRYTHIPVETMVEVCNWILRQCIPERLAELKKKYTEEGK